MKSANLHLLSGLPGDIGKLELVTDLYSGVSRWLRSGWLGEPYLPCAVSAISAPDGHGLPVYSFFCQLPFCFRSCNFGVLVR